MKLTKRPTYTNRIIPFINKQVIKVLTGQRRVGKSYVMLELIENIKATDENANIVYINMEVDDFSHIKTHEDLSAYLKDKFASDKNNYFFIDEVLDASYSIFLLYSILNDFPEFVYFFRMTRWARNETQFNNFIQTFISY